MKLSVQLYSLRDAGDLATQLQFVREAGFDHVESVCTHGLPAAEFAALLKLHGLHVPSMHVPLSRLESELASVVDDCRATRCPLVVMPWLPMGERPATAAGWAAMGRRLAALGERLHEHGLRLAYHNHDFEFLQYDGRAALDWLFDGVTPSQLAWEADLGWVARAGADPFEWTSRLADRLVALHAKDIAPPHAALDEDGWAALGEGIMPWRRLLSELAHVPLVVFEHDRPRDVQAVLRTSRVFLERHAAGA
jgi:sugar phosphate isomerase/epimerase